MKIQAIEVARILNEMTRVFPRIDGSFPLHWEDLTDEQQNTSVDAIRRILKRYSYNFLHPADLHDIWFEGNYMNGWKYGETYCPTNKTHPCMVPFERLPETEVLKDQIWAEVLKLYGPYIVWEN